MDDFPGLPLAVLSRGRPQPASLLPGTATPHGPQNLVRRGSHCLERLIVSHNLERNASHGTRSEKSGRHPHGYRPIKGKGLGLTILWGFPPVQVPNLALPRHVLIRRRRLPASTHTIPQSRKKRKPCSSNTVRGKWRPQRYKSCRKGVALTPGARSYALPRPTFLRGSDMKDGSSAKTMGGRERSADV